MLICNFPLVAVVPSATFPAKGAILTNPFAFTSKLGMPVISFTLNIVPELRLSVIEKS